MEVRFPTQDTVLAALVALLRAKGYDRPGNGVEVAVLSKGGRPAYQVTPATQAARLLASELAIITGRQLDLEPSWVLLQGDVNLLFGAVRQQVSARVSHGIDNTL
jgi:hypothetical protein